MSGVQVQPVAHVPAALRIQSGQEALAYGAAASNGLDNVFIRSDKGDTLVYSQRGLDLNGAKVGSRISFGDDAGTIVQVDRQVNTAARGAAVALAPALAMGAGAGALSMERVVARLATYGFAVPEQGLLRALFHAVPSNMGARQFVWTHDAARVVRMGSVAVGVGVAVGAVALGAALAAQRPADHNAVAQYAAK